MSTMYAMRRQLDQYRQFAPMAEAAIADPHRQIQMLLEVALERIAVARGAMAQGNVQVKGEKLGHGISIIEGLRALLDYEKGGEVAENLGALYEYMTQRLLEGSARNDPQPLDEVMRLLREVKAGWDGIPDAMRKAS